MRGQFQNGRIKQARYVLALIWSLVCFAAPGKASPAQTTLTFVQPKSSFVAGNRAALVLYAVNDSQKKTSLTFAQNIPCTITWGEGSTNTVIVLDPGSGGDTATIRGGTFTRRQYWLQVPLISGPLRIEPIGYNPIEATVEAPPSAGAVPPPKPPSLSGSSKSSRPIEDILWNRLRPYEPIYFILGTYPAAEFQFSVKYQVFSFAKGQNKFKDVLDDFYLAYTQTSFWDLISSDPSFYDTSYKPSAFLFFTNVLGSKNPGAFQLDLQAGSEHESNGRGGDLERSLYTGYLQPTVKVGLSHGLSLELQPRARFYYFVGHNNPDIAQYRGYADLLGALTWEDPATDERIQFSTKFRIGDEGTHAGLQYDLRFNLVYLKWFRAFNPTIQLQYFQGYGQTLRQYDQTSHAFRAGICLYY